MMPSHISSSILTEPFSATRRCAICLVWRSSETSLNASAVTVLPLSVTASVTSGCSGVACARARRCGQIVYLIVIHQETDRAELHAIDRQAARDVPVQRAQHEAVAAERDDDRCIVDRDVAVARFQRGERALRFLGRCGDECDAGGVHGGSSRWWRAA